MNIQMEMANVKATLQNMITSVNTDEEFDILGSLLAISNQLERLDEAIDTKM